MNDSNAPLELDDISRPDSSKRKSAATGVLVATLLGSVSAFTLFFLVFGGIDSPETQGSDSQTASDSLSEFDSSPKPTESIQLSSKEESDSTNPPEPPNSSSSEPIVSNEVLEPYQSVLNDDKSKQASELTVETTTALDEPSQMPELVNGFKLGEPINLLDQIDPEKHATRGSWKRENQSLVAQDKVITCLAWPFELPRNYVLRIKLSSTEGLGAFYIKTGWDAHSTDLVLNGWNRTIGGLHLLDGRQASAPDNPTQFLSPMIGTDEPTEVIVIVYDDSIQVTIDETTALNWSGSPEELSIAHSRVPETKGTFWMGTVRTSWKVSLLSLIPIEGLERLAIPDKQQIEAAEAAIEEKMQIDFRRVRNNEKLEVARKLHVESATVEDSVERYVLFKRALEFSSEAGDLELPMTLCESLAEEFQVPLRDLQFDSIETISKARRDPLSSYQLSVYVTNLAWRSADDHNYAEAGRFADEAFDLAKRSRITSLIEQVGKIREQFESWESGYQKVAEAHQRIVEGKETADDFLAWGRFLSLKKENWKDGLEMLSLGGSNVLAEAAREELQQPRQFQEVISLIEKWLAAAEQFPDEDKQTLVTHAHEISVHAYSLAENDQRLILQQHFRELFKTQKLWKTSEEPKGIAIGGENANPPQEATVELWLRTTDRDGGCLMKREERDYGTIVINILGGRAELAVNAHFYVDRKQSEKVVSDGQWHHLAATRMGKRLQLFVDGELSAELIARDDFPKTNPGAWRLGFFNGVHLAGEFARIRVSSECRYHTRFVPERRYEADRNTMMLW